MADSRYIVDQFLEFPRADSYVKLPSPVFTVNPSGAWAGRQEVHPAA